MTGRTVAEVVNDPANAELASLAAAKFAAAEVAPTLEESFALFSAGVELVRKINQLEAKRS